jgi:hypothetical protein
MVLDVLQPLMVQCFRRREPIMWLQCA